MRFATDLVEGKLLRRYQRFFADVELDDGSVVVAHCANTGSMKTCLEPGTRAWLTRAREGRKLPFTWEVAERETEGGTKRGPTRIYVNPAGANGLTAEGITEGVVAELTGYDSLRREVRYGTNSRIDLLLERGSERCYVEVKNVTLHLGAGRAAFPDAVTTRGTKHLEELMQVVREGHRAVAFFCVARTDCDRFEPAGEIDPLYAATLRRAVEAGVEVLAYGVSIDREQVRLSHPLPVQLGVAERAAQVAGASRA